MVIGIRDWGQFFLFLILGNFQNENLKHIDKEIWRGALSRRWRSASGAEVNPAGNAQNNRTAYYCILGKCCYYRYSG